MITAKNFWLWFGGIWFGVGLPFFVLGLFLGVQQHTVTTRLDAEGKTVDGMVLTKSMTSSSSSSSRNTSPTYKVTFRFTAPSGIITGESQVTEETWDRLVEREPIQVTYLADEPNRYRIEGQSSGWVLPVIFTVLGGVFTLLGGFVLLNARSQLRTQERVRREGVTTTATIVELRQANIRINRVTQWLARYRYQDQLGQTHHGKETLSPKEARRWKEGAEVTVRYDQRQPDTSVWIGST